LLLNNSDRVYDLLQEIEELNLERRALTKTFTEEAFSQIEGKDNIIIFDSPDIPH
jgi:single-stranded DNA-specific DHH superfamily exonuclease